jgi:hypothetical protein
MDERFTYFLLIAIPSTCVFWYIADILIGEATKALLLIPRGDRFSDVDPLDSPATSFHRTGLALPNWPSKRESLLASHLAQIRCALVCNGVHWLR